MSSEVVSARTDKKDASSEAPDVSGLAIAYPLVRVGPKARPVRWGVADPR
jgi:hypothetical protein